MLVFLVWLEPYECWLNTQEQVWPQEKANSANNSSSSMNSSYFFLFYFFNMWGFHESILAYPLQSYDPIFISVFLAWLSFWKTFKICTEAFSFWRCMQWKESLFYFSIYSQKNPLSDFNGNASVSNNRQQKYSGNIASVLRWSNYDQILRP